MLRTLVLRGDFVTGQLLNSLFGPVESLLVYLVHGQGLER